MAETSALQSRGQLRLPQAAAFLDWLLPHWEQEGVQLQRLDARQPAWHLQLPGVGAVLLQLPAADTLACTLWPASPAMLALIKFSLQEHAEEFLALQGASPLALQLHWADQGIAPGTGQARVQCLQVLQVQDITPRLRRFRLQSPDIAAFAGEGLHLRLLLPDPAHPPHAWPQMDEDGRLQWPAHMAPLPHRTYTIRSVNHVAGWLEVDFLRHGHAQAPGGRWAEHAQAGDTLAAVIPAGGLLPQASRLLLCGDACAVPAMARVLQSLPAAAQAQAWVLAPAPEEARYLATHSHHPVHWLPQTAAGHDDDGGDGTAALCLVLEQALTTAPQAPDLLWGALGHAQASTLRHWARTQHPRLRTQISSYWR
jgi:NADPH-dependent ferric siderophore reductase